MSGREQLDISPQKREVLEWKAARRAKLRETYLKETYHPERKQAVFDEAIYRVMAAEAKAGDYFEPNFKIFRRTAGLVIGSILLLGFLTKKARNYQENLYRTGQISYADRDFKFV